MTSLKKSVMTSLLIGDCSLINWTVHSLSPDVAFAAATTAAAAAAAANAHAYVLLLAHHSIEVN